MGTQPQARKGDFHEMPVEVSVFKRHAAPNNRVKRRGEVEYRVRAVAGREHVATSDESHRLAEGAFVSIPSGPVVEGRGVVEPAN